MWAEEWSLGVTQFDFRSDQWSEAGELVWSHVFARNQLGPELPDIRADRYY